MQLAAEGYIKAHDRSPYEVLPLPILLDNGSHFAKNHEMSGTVAEVDNILNEKTTESDLSGVIQNGISTEPTRLTNQGELAPKATQAVPIRYNFATGAMDPEGFDYTRWKRYIGYILREPERLLAYGHPQGEPELRAELAQYLNNARAVRTTVDHIIIGSGTQAMVMMLAALLKRAGLTTVAVDASVIIGVTHIFNDYGFTVITVDQHSETLLEDLYKAGVEALYCTPSHGDRQGRVMSVGRRKELLHWAAEQNSYLIEDDYDSELRYYGRPISSLQGMATTERVIYLGTPSKVLPPSIRISYMVLPPVLWSDFLTYRTSYRQSAGVMEQLVWARYIKDGEWSKQIRRLRKHYADKSKVLAAQLQQTFGDTVKVYLPEGGVYIGLTIFTDKGADALLQKAREAGCDVRIEADGDDEVRCLLSFSAIPTNELEAAVKELGKAWKGL